MWRVVLRALALLLATVVAAAALQMVRQAEASAAVERAWQTETVQRVTNLGTTRTLTILPWWMRRRATRSYSLSMV
jgi:hypothetical protein